MLHVVSYDISSDAVRDSMNRTLLDFGSRIQESVFECVLNTQLHAEMMARLQRLVFSVVAPCARGASPVSVRRQSFTTGC